MSSGHVKASKRRSSSKSTRKAVLAKNGSRKSLLTRAVAPSRNGNRKTKGRSVPPHRRSTILRTRNPKVSSRLSRGPLKHGARRHAVSRILINGNGTDRIMLMARDPYWLHAYWEITLSSVQRAEAALREDWHGARPILRLIDVSSEDTTSSSERHVRDIEIHGCVNNWYIDVPQPPRTYRVEVGYMSRRGRFFCLAHSNVVTTPGSDSTDLLDEQLANVQKEFERICSASGANPRAAQADARHAEEDPLNRPLSSAPWANFAIGALPAARKRGFWFELDAELIVHGSTQPSSRVTLHGERVPLRQDGTFTMRFRLPDKRLIIPATAASPEGCEERTIVLAVERNTKELEPMVHEHHREE